MDPNACLHRLQEAAERSDHDEVSAAMSDYNSWREMNGASADVDELESALGAVVDLITYG